MIDDKYRRNQNWSKWPRCVTKTSDIELDWRWVSFYREGKSHRGISSFAQQITRLSAKQVNGEFLCEIAKLKNLEYLEIDRLSSNTLLPLVDLKNLETLKISGVSKAENFEVLASLPNLRYLFLENAKTLNNLECLSGFRELISLGVEGTMHTNQMVLSLQPISSLPNLEALFLSSVSLKEKSILCLADLPKIRVLSCARFTTREHFSSLQSKKPNLKCRWFEAYEI
ncbi:hypothetical protein MID13_07800 [Vibrio gigantis]|uniref:hypothetical protein n=1 Tax=Vibrio gigantis TaxID=296199 RepID=UPI001EFA7C21|nr:hypothetical protein [Vibrio gigantis]ULN65686.1 hypothetical protein MID13_07800 [Vibrio gigantis]